jgi:hypothetical protein
MQHVVRQLNELLATPSSLPSTYSSSSSSSQSSTTSTSISVPDPSAFRAIALILQNPLLSRSTASEHAIINDIARIISRLPISVKNQLKLWWSGYPRHIFGSRLVRMLSSMIEHTLQQQSAGQGGRPVRQPNDDVIAAVEMLVLMKQSSDLVTPPIVTSSSFHVNILSYVDIPYHLAAWIERPPTSSQLPRTQHFSPLPRTCELDC